MRDQFFDHRHFGLCGLVAGAHALGEFLRSFLQRAEIGQPKLSRDDLDVADGVNGTAHVMDVVILKTAHHLHDRGHLADMAEELVPEALALARAAHQAGDVHEFNRRRDEFFRVGKLREHIEPRVGYGHDPLVGINGAKGIVRRDRLAGACYGVEQSGLPDIWQTDDSCA